MLWVLQTPGGMFLSPNGRVVADINQAALYESRWHAQAVAAHGATPVEYARAKRMAQHHAAQYLNRVQPGVFINEEV